MDRPCESFLACAGLSLKQDGDALVQHAQGAVDVRHHPPVSASEPIHRGGAVEGPPCGFAWHRTDGLALLREEPPARGSVAQAQRSLALCAVPFFPARLEKIVKGQAAQRAASFAEPRAHERIGADDAPFLVERQQTLGCHLE